MSNLYWPIYKNLEREVLYLADLIHFCDSQANVYSVRIADMLIRCSVEIESLISELYDNIVHDEETDKIGAKLKRLDTKLNLTDKQVTITSLNMHFSKEYSTFSPFNYAKSDNNDYYSAYNSVKHNRMKNFKTKATLHFLLHALAALFILNIYYKNEEIIFIGKSKVLPNPNFGSDIFSIYTTIIMPDKHGNAVYQSPEDRKALYIVTATKKLYKEYLEHQKRAHRLKVQEMQRLAPDKYNKKDKNDDEAGEENNIQLNYDTDFVELVKQEDLSTDDFVKSVQTIATIDSKPAAFLSDLRFEAVLNKNQVIYLGIDEEEKLHG